MSIRHIPRRAQIVPALKILGMISMIGAVGCAQGPSARPAQAPGRRPVEAGPCSRAFVLVDHGRLAARIEIPDGAGDIERRAAEILRDSIFKMSGVDLPILAAREPGGPGVAAIGFPPKDLPPVISSSLASLRPDGFVVATSTGNLYVTGGGGKGVVNGVVHLLEKYFGCRIFSPTAELFPRRGDLALGCLFEVDNPVNEVRSLPKPGSPETRCTRGPEIVVHLDEKKTSGIIARRD